MYISITDNGESFFSEGIVVRFYKEDGTNWVANFRPGFTELKAIFELTETTNLLVIADGLCYLMNPEHTQPLSTFGMGYHKVFTTQDGRLILQDQTNFTIVESNGGHWDTVRISWDGFENVDLNANTLTGLSYDPTNQNDEWTNFSYNIDTKELVGGSYPNSLKSQKSKWKFW
jgi:hypothetical protein